MTMKKTKKLTSDILNKASLLHAQIIALNTLLDDTKSEEYKHISYLTFAVEKELKSIRKKAEKLESIVYSSRKKCYRSNDKPC